MDELSLPLNMAYKDTISSWQNMLLCHIDLPANIVKETKVIPLVKKFGAYLAKKHVTPFAKKQKAPDGCKQPVLASLQAHAKEHVATSSQSISDALKGIGNWKSVISHIRTLRTSCIRV